MPGQSYPRQFVPLTVTCTKGTAKASPQVNTWNLGNVLLNRLSVRVPRGHAGLTGIVVLYNGLAIFPFGQPPSYLVTTGETVGQDFSEEELGSALTIQTYNTDIFDHSFYLRADINVWLPRPNGEGAVAVVPIA